MANNNFYTPTEIFNLVYSGNTLVGFNTETDILNAVFDESQSALRISVDGGGGSESLSTSLSNEIVARISGDGSLSTAVRNIIVSGASYDDSSISTAISSEASIRISEDGILSTAIDNRTIATNTSGDYNAYVLNEGNNINIAITSGSSEHNGLDINGIVDILAHQVINYDADVVISGNRDLTDKQFVTGITSTKVDKVGALGRTQINNNNNDVTLRYSTGNTTSYIQTNWMGHYFSVSGSTSNNSITITENDTTFARMADYNEDVSNTYTDRSLVDKGFVTGLTSGITTSISTEISDRTSSDLSLSSSISVNSSSIVVLSTNLSGEISNNVVTDSYLQSQIDSLAAVQTTNTRLYFNNTNSDFGYETLKTTVTSLTEITESVVLSATTEFLVDSYISASGLTTGSIDGLYAFHFHASVSATNATNQLHIYLFKRNSGGTETQLTKQSINITSTAILEYQTDFILTGVTFSSDGTDRLVAKIYASTTGGSRTMVWVYGSSSRFAYVELPLPTNASPVWASITGKPAWLSGNTLTDFQLAHSHSQYALSTGLSTEISNRTSSDLSLSTAISSVPNLSGSLSTEVSNRTSGDLSLSSAISTLSGGTELDLDSTLDDGELLGKVGGSLVGVTNIQSSLSSSLVSEISSRTSSDLSLSTAISSVPNLSGSLSTEVSNRTSGDSSLSSSLSTTNSSVTSLSSSLGSVATYDIWVGTQEDYDLLTPDANTLYYITV